MREAHDGVAGFGQCELLTDTDARATVEGDVGPAGTEMRVRPSFGAEFMGVGSVDVGSAVQGVGGEGESGVRRAVRLVGEWSGRMRDMGEDGVLLSFGNEDW